MKPYPDAIYAMHDLLGALNETRWKEWLACDIEEWEKEHSTSHHLEAYCGSESFREIGFTDPWLGTLFEDLRSLCFGLAHEPECVPASTDLNVWLGGDEALALQGWRCRACGYGVVSRRNLESFVTKRVLRKALLQAVKKSRVRLLVAKVVQGPLLDKVFTMERVLFWMTQSAVRLREADGWCRPCPACSSEATALYRWDLRKDGHFVPAKDNLPLRSGVIAEIPAEGTSIPELVEDSKKKGVLKRILGRLTRE